MPEGFKSGPVGAQAIAAVHVGLAEVVDFRNGYESIPARPSFLDAELSRMVSELARDVEQFNSLVHSQRRLLQQGTGDEESAQRQWSEIRARACRITIKAHAVLDEIAIDASS